MDISPKQKAYSVEEIRKTYSKAYAKWTQKEDDLLKQAYKQLQNTNQSYSSFVKDYSEKVGRKRGAIYSRIKKIINGEITYKPASQKTKQTKTTPPKPPALKLDINPEFQKAINLLENTNKNVFITGRAGTGKSTLLNYFRNTTKKKVAVLAPTGVAALNVRGQTIHSFFKFKPNTTLQNIKHLYKKDDAKNLYAKIDAIIIDEISMVRSDLLDCIDKFLRLNRNNSEPFGAVQMIFIGDLYQLPPVVTSSERHLFKTHYESPYFFGAKVLKELPMEFIELETVYRQKDNKFIELLNSIRNNSATAEHLEHINRRYDPAFTPNPKNFSIYLTTTNDLAEIKNNEQLASLNQKEHTYVATVDGSFEKNSFPTEGNLSLKVGAQVMMLNNDSLGRWVNGTIGKIINIQKGKTDFEEDEDAEDKIIVQFNNGQVREVTPFTWELFRFTYNEEKNSLSSETIGTFTQYPMRLAWAVTIHKSQGKTFDNVVIDIGRGTFVHGQLYVALSRCTTLEGIVLKQPIEKKHIRMDWSVVRFITGFQYQKSNETLPIEEKIQILKNAATNKQSVNITYLKAGDEKSKRIIEPVRVDEMEYQGKIFLGVVALDHKTQQTRTFRVDRILELSIII